VVVQPQSQQNQMQEKKENNYLPLLGMAGLAFLLMKH
jgi:hypothetical protein